MAKPTDDVHWATDDINNVEPDATLKDEGYATDAVPTSAEFNWMLWAICVLLNWIADLFDSTGALKRGPRVRHISTSAGHQVDSGTAVGVNSLSDIVNTTAATNVYQIPIVLEEGERLLLVEARVFDAGSDVLTMKVFKADYSGASPGGAQLGVTANSVGAAGNYETLTTGALTEDVDATYTTYFANFTCTYSAGGGIGGLWITTDFPGV